jgi:hypothetical protein
MSSCYDAAVGGGSALVDDTGAAARVRPPRHGLVVHGLAALSSQNDAPRHFRPRHTMAAGFLADYWAKGHNKPVSQRRLLALIRVCACPNLPDRGPVSPPR